MSQAWDYRVVRKESENGSDEWYSVQEIYYDDDGTPMAQTIDLQVEGDSISEMRKRLEGMIKCLQEPVLDEQDIIDSASNYDYDFNDDGVIDDLDYNAAADLLQGSDPNLLNLIMLNSLGISTPEAMTDFAGGAGVGGGPTGWGTWMEYAINVGGNLA